MDNIGSFLAIGGMALTISIAIFRGFKSILSTIQESNDRMEKRLNFSIGKLEGYLAVLDKRLGDLEKDVCTIKGILSVTHKIDKAD